jgi:hypothetical protein
LACASDTDCIGSQACTSDGFCAVSAATHCAQRQVPVDATTSPASDANRMADAGAGSDSAAKVAVHITVQGNGTVTSSAGPTCTDDCTFEVAPGLPMTLTATPNSAHHMFATWSGACASQPALCQVTPTAAITAGARFTPNEGD